MLLGLALATSFTLAAGPDYVAQVVALKQPVSVASAPKKQGEPVGDRPKDLLKTDIVKVGVGGLAVIKLKKNGYLVRVDDDLDLPVKDIVLLEAERTTVPLEDQLASLLSPEERAQNNRMAGWISEVSGASVAMPPSKAAEGGAAKPEPKSLTAKSRKQSSKQDEERVADSSEKESAARADRAPERQAAAVQVRQEASVAEAAPGGPLRDSAATGGPSASRFAEPTPPASPTAVPPSPPSPPPPPPRKPMLEQAGRSAAPAQALAAKPITEKSVQECLGRALGAAARGQGLKLGGRTVKVKLRAQGGGLLVLVPTFGFKVPAAQQCVTGWSTAKKDLEVTLE